jgi:hypothetical protein
VEASSSSKVRTGHGSHPGSCTGFLYSGVRRPQRGVDHPPKSSSEVNERVELYLYYHSGSSWPVIGSYLPLIYLPNGLTLQQTDVLCNRQTFDRNYGKYRNISLNKNCFYSMKGNEWSFNWTQDRDAQFILLLPFILQPKGTIYFLTDITTILEGDCKRWVETCRLTSTAYAFFILTLY